MKALPILQLAPGNRWDKHNTIAGFKRGLPGAEGIVDRDFKRRGFEVKFIFLLQFAVKFQGVLGGCFHLFR